MEEAGAAVVLEALPVEVEVAFYGSVRAVIAGNPDGAADVCAKVVFLVGRLAGCSVLLGVEGVVAEILITSAVEGLAAAPGLHDELAGSGVSVLCVIIGAQDFDFAGDIGRHTEVSLQAHHPATDS